MFLLNTSVIIVILEIFNYISRDSQASNEMTYLHLNFECNTLETKTERRMVFFFFE